MQVLEGRLGSGAVNYCYCHVVPGFDFCWTGKTSLGADLLCPVTKWTSIMTPAM